jgi:hypothetical protein
MSQQRNKIQLPKSLSLYINYLISLLDITSEKLREN